MSEKKIRFLFNTAEFFGSTNPMISLAELLKKRGHEIIFMSNESFRQTILDCGFIYEAKLEVDSVSPQQQSEYLMSTGLLTAKSSIETLQIDNNFNVFANIFIQLQKCEHNIISKCIEKYKPDIIVQYCMSGNAESVNSGLPWVGIYLENPLSFYNNAVLPPFYSGYATNSDPYDWKEYEIVNKQWNDLIKGTKNKYYREHGFPEISTTFQISPYLNIYGYPKELDYSDIVEVPEKWFRVDSFFHNQSRSEYVLPKHLENKSGKLIYVSMGTIGSINLDFMNNLVSVLSKSEHRFIVSKGMRGSEYSLYDNMCGDNYLPQTAILQKVDLFITHGGNNSISEAFYFGKPMIVMPFICDQYDNAQRIHETGFGIRLNTQLYTENELLSAIETLLNNSELSTKMKNISDRIQSDKSLVQAVKMIENLKE